jgi:DNA-3-methyladenine glycosylase I
MRNRDVSDELFNDALLKLHTSNFKLQTCPWCGTDPLYVAYHDSEWGVPVYDEGRLFELLILEGAQAGLSWLTILRKRDGYRRAFHGFDAARMARYGDADVARLLADSGIVRNRLKIQSAIGNARVLLDLYDRGSTLNETLWRHVDGEPRHNHWQSLAEVPTTTPMSDAMSRELKRLGFKFVGSTICYALMQAGGLVNDHLVTCYRHAELLSGAAPVSPRPERSGPLVT